MPAIFSSHSLVPKNVMALELGSLKEMLQCENRFPQVPVADTIPSFP